MAKKTIFFDDVCGYVTSAVVEDAKIAEFNFEKYGSSTLVGNIYKGRITSVLAGMQAAFVDCGLERSCYLSADDVFPYAGKYDGSNGETPAFPALHEGDEIAVQVVKPPVGTKGARVTAFHSIVGKHLIYMPNTPFVGVSRKIADNELRSSLIYSVSSLISGDEGVILRTEAPYAKHGVLKIELKYLRNMYQSIAEAFKYASVGELLYTDVTLPVRVLRDTLISDIDKIIVGTPKLETLINNLVRLFPPDSRCPVIYNNSGRDLFDAYGLSGQIDEICATKVGLENGGNLVIEKTEAMTVIDVNTGRYTGNSNLEQTVYYTNILAAREIARQVRLRNTGGIVVVDFIDMNDPAHRKAVQSELENSLKRDSAKCAVMPMSGLGLIEFTRKRQGVSPLSLMTRQCGHCRSGSVKTPRFIILGIRLKLLNLFADGERTIRIDLNKEIFDELVNWHEFCTELKERLCGASVYCVPHKTYNEEVVNYRTDASSLPDKAIKLI